MNKFFRKLSLPVKLMLIAFLPLVFILYLAQQVYTEKSDKIKILEGFIKNNKRSVYIAAAVDLLQSERRHSYGFAVKGQWQTEMLLQREKTDTALAKLYQLQDDDLKDFQSYTMLSGLSAARSMIDKGQIDAENVMTYYTNIIFRLNYLNSVAGGNITSLKPIQRVLAGQKLLSEYITYFGLLRGDIYSSLLKNVSPSQMSASLHNLYDISNSYEAEFLQKTSPQSKEEYNAVKQTGDVKRTFTYLDDLFTKQKAGTPFSAEDWWHTSAFAVDKIKEIQRNLVNNAGNTLNETYNNEKNGLRNTVIILVLVLFAVLFIVSYIIRVITKMLTELKDAAQELSVGKTGININIESKDAIGSLSESIIKIDASNKAVADTVSEVGKGNFNLTLTPRSDEDILVNSIKKMKLNLRKFSHENEEKIWIHTGLEVVNESIAGDKVTKDLSKDALEALMAYIDCEVGLLYVCRENVLELMLTSAMSDEDAIPKQIKKGEFLTGKAVSEKKMRHLKDVPDDYIKIKSATGSAKAKEVIILPLLHDNSVHGVIELASLKPFSEAAISMLNQASLNIAIALEGALNREKMQRLLEQTTVQAEELLHQHNELENLNTELEIQAQKLQASEEELKVQHEELLQANRELEERARLLEERNQLIVERNHQVQQKAKELEQSTKYKSEFLANMSHELRTPLNSILLLARLLSENNEGNLTADQIEFATVIQTSGTGLLSLIDEILDLSKIEAGKMELDFEDTSVASIVSDMSALFSPVAREKKIEFKVETGDVPKTIKTDKSRLEQVLKNLISNAVKFTSHGSVLFSAEPAKDKKDTIAFSVKDTGIGIAKEKQDVIFEAFRQEDGSTRRKFGGTGLGLSISRELVKLLGGQIELKSEQGKGSEFIIYIPIAQPKTHVAEKDKNIFDEPVKLPEEESSKPAHHTTQKETAARYISSIIPASISDDREKIEENDKVILIVEDDTYFAKALMDFTRKKGYKCVVSVRGDEGLAMAKQFKPTGILLDIQLPVKDGWEVMEDLKADPATRHIPVHIMSAHASKKESITKGAIDFINKPVALDQMHEVFKKIEQVISKEARKVLIVEENPKHAQALAYFLETFSITSEITSDIGKGVDALKKGDADCVILDMGIPDANAYETLEAVKKSQGMESVPVIIFTGKSLSKTEEQRLKQYADSIVIKTAYSYQRILDEVSLFLHLVEEGKEDKREADRYRNGGALTEILNHRSILITDDDVRNIFSLTKALEQHNMKVYSAMDGEEALALLSGQNDIDVVLMDIMMPRMDGYETIKRIRQNFQYRDLPIIAVTAKAMTGDREKCIKAGASDYISKPVDIDQLLSLLRVWLYEKA